MNPPEAQAQVPQAKHAPAARELLHESGTTRVFRVRPPDGPAMVCKQPLGPAAPDRLRHEARMLARLAGVQGVPKLLAGPHPSGVIAFEDQGGIPLPLALPRMGFDLPQVLSLALRLARIVAAMHRRGVLHQNINPANILLCEPQQEPLLIDFRLATTFAEGQPGFIHHRDIQGTLAYLAPEQTGRTGRSVDQRADLYSLGATFYEIVTGQPPFVQQDPLQLIHDHLVRPPVAPAALVPGLPQALSDIITRLLEKEPDRRYQSAEGLAHDLDQLCQRLARGDHAPLRLGEHDFAQRLSPPSRLIGRESEIRTLRQAFEQALQGRSRVVLVAGAPGVGKTSLINELRPIVSASRGWFVSGKFDQYRQDDAPTATVQALQALGRLLLAEPEAELALQRARILRLLGPNAGLLCTSPEYESLLGPQPKVPAIDPIQAETRGLLAFHDLLRAVVSPVRPLVMVLDDLQWAGPISIRVIESLLESQDLAGLLLVGAYREAEVAATHPLGAALPRWAWHASAPTLLRLANLPAAGLGDLLAEMLRLPAERAAALGQALAAHTDGNPYDTVELVNALRREGALAPGPDGWEWDTAAVRRHIGQGNVIDLLAARIGRIPPQGRCVLEIMACLGGDVPFRLLSAASGLRAAELEELLATPLEDGLLVQEQGGEGLLRFRHDRVQQAAYGPLSQARREELHLAIARRLARQPEFAPLAADQYLPAAASMREPAERRAAARLLHDAAAVRFGLTNYAAAERFLAGAIALLGEAQTPADRKLLALLATGQHAALYSMGRLDEADRLYRSIEHHCATPVDLVEAACVQVSSLTNRGRPRDALALGLGLLRKLGIVVPAADAMSAEVSRELDAFYQWVSDATRAGADRRAPATDASIVAVAALINRLMPAARLCDPTVVAWLVLESQRLWAAHGPCSKLAACLGHATLVTIATRDDYRSGYQAVGHVLATCEALGWLPEAAQVRDLFALSTSHWFEPLERSVALVREAREGLLRQGDLQGTCFADYISITALLDCAPNLDLYAGEIEAALAFARRTGNAHGTDLYLVHRQLLRLLRGRTMAPGSLSDGDFDELQREQRLGANPSADATFHLVRTVAAVLTGDMAALVREAQALVALRSYLQSFYATALLHLLHAMAQAQRLKDAAPHARPALLAELNASCQWLARRALDAPGNFGHLVLLVDAERAWAMGDAWSAARAFDAALHEAEGRPRPWHAALIAERAALFHLEQGLQRTGNQLLAQARDLYQAWGAAGKVQALQRRHGLAPPVHAQAAPLPGASDTEAEAEAIDTIDTIDMLGIVRASQALSSETSLARLQSRVVELLGAMTGATTVRFVLWHEDVRDWFLSAAADADAAVPLSVEEAGARGLLPLSAFRYAERTREPLLVEDATGDDRFARDPALAGLERCSLLVIPILNQGAPRAMLLLENRLSRGAFSARRLDAVLLIAGQLAVSLENALLYQELEQRVQQRTRELREAQAELVGTARRAGMAEIATNVLHNVGNILNSVNISADVVSSRLSASKAQGLTRLAQLLESHAGDLGAFLSTDEKGRLLPGYVSMLAQAVAQEQQELITELGNLTRSVDHIKNVVATQQSYAGRSSVLEPVRMRELMEDALRINSDSLARHQVAVIKDFTEVPQAQLDKGRVMQILVNLIRNATQAMSGVSDRPRRLTLRLDAAEACLRVSVEDEGTGIPQHNLTRIFAHGFTTRQNGHGFGLHSCALAAREMGGTLVARSDGPDRGATFTLELPLAGDHGKP